MLNLRQLVAIILVALFGPLGCGQKVRDGPPQPLGPPDFSLTATEFQKEFKVDPKAAEAKYAGKVVELRGVVDSAGRHDDKVNGQIVLSAEDGGKTLIGCFCYVSDKNIGATLGKGQTVRLKGLYWRNFVVPQLSACEIVEKGPDTLVPVTAEQLAKDYVADADAHEARYKKKPLLVSGEVLAVKTDENKVIYVELKGSGATVIELRYIYLFEGGWPKEFKAGARVRFVASTHTLINKPGVLGLLMDTPLDLE